MRKFAAVFVILALFGTAVFAQEATGVRVTGWGRTIFEPLKIVQPDGGDLEVGATAGYGWYRGAAVGVSFAGSAEKVGFNLDYRATDAGNSLVVADNAYIWIKPLDFLTIGAGKFNGPADFGLRGKYGSGSGNGLAGLLGSIGGEDDIFRRFAPYNGNHAGAVFVLQPIDGLVIGGVVNADIKTLNDEAVPFTSLDTDAYKKLQLTAGYTIANIGLIRAQFLGGPQKGTGTADANRIQVAFALTAVEGLTLDIGGLIPLEYTGEDEITYKHPIGVSVGASFGAGDLTIGGRVDTQFAGSKKAEGSDDALNYGFDVRAFLEPAYKLGDVTVAADLVLQYTGEDSQGSTAVKNTGGIKVGAGVWLGFNLGSGALRIGLAAKLPTEYDPHPDTTKDAKGKSALEFSVPIGLQYSF
jgi:hypothetical protein